jgi:hypothetical protein
MFKLLRTFAIHITVWGLAAARHGLEALCSHWEALRYRHDRIPIEVLVTNGTRRRKIERELRAGLRQLQRMLGERPVADVGVVVQQVITMDRQLAGCSHLGQRADGTQYALWRLALQVNGRPLAADELLAVLAEQWIGLAKQRQGTSVLVPVDFEPSEATSSRRAHTLPPDPLMPYSEVRNSHRA